MIGKLPVANGEPTGAVSNPVAGAIVKPEASFDPELAIYKNLPLKSTVAPKGASPVAVVPIGVRTPVGLIENDDTVAAALLAT